MNKRTLLKIVNVLLAILILNQATSAFLHDFLPEDAFEFFHEGGGVTLFIIALIHVYLNWAWVKSNILSSGKKGAK